MPYYEISYTQQQGTLPLDTITDQTGEPIEFEDGFQVITNPSNVGGGIVYDILSEAGREGVFILSDATPPTVGSNLTTANWVVSVDSVETITLGGLGSIPIGATPSSEIELSRWNGYSASSRPAKIFNQVWSGDPGDYVVWNGMTYVMPEMPAQEPITQGFESFPDPSYSVGTGLVTWTNDGTAHTGRYYFRMLRNLTTSINPGISIKWQFHNLTNYQVKLWARVPSASLSGQLLYIRHDLTSMGVPYLGQQQVTIPNDNTWREYTFDFVMAATQGIDLLFTSGWWIQHAGSQTDANAFIDIDNVSVACL